MGGVGTSAAELGRTLAAAAAVVAEVKAALGEVPAPGVPARTLGGTSGASGAAGGTGG